MTAIANPQSTSTGNVTNQAVQVLQGPYHTNSYGGGITCQGPTMNFTPFISSSFSGSTPYEQYADLDNDPLTSLERTGQKDRWAFNPGASLTVSFPLDGGLQARCKDAAETWTARQAAETDKARLDFELVRLLKCGEAIKSGVYFHPQSPFAKVCADVVVPGVPSLVVASPPSAPSPTSSEQPLSPLSSPEQRTTGSRMESGPSPVPSFRVGLPASRGVSGSSEADQPETSPVERQRPTPPPSFRPGSLR